MRAFVASALALSSIGLSGVVARAQEVSLEYRVKAAYLFNFTKFVEWPADAREGTPLTICLATQNPFGSVLADTIRDERVKGRPLDARVVRTAAGCHVLFVPHGVRHEPYLRETRNQPVLTVGEARDFLRDGGIVNFVVEDGKVRFEIDRDTAARANLTISSRLLRLARAAVSGRMHLVWHAE